VAAARLISRLAANRWIRAASLHSWLLLLVLPSATTFSSSLSWDASPLFLLLATVWCFGLLWLLLGPRLFFIATYPLALFAAMVLIADFIRSVNLLEMVMVGGGAEGHEAASSLRAYALPIFIAAIALAIPVAIANAHDWKRSLSPRSRKLAAVALGALGVAMLLLFPATFLRAWPINLASLGVASITGRTEFLATALPWSPINPRNASATWQASRQASTASHETYVFVIGESVRADRLAACGNPRRVLMSHPAIVYCDMTAASSSTHTAVPLLVSREMPGSTLRVSTDATFLRAFEEAGFRTYWFGVQPESVAWPDANVEKFVRVGNSDREDLLPLLRSALAEPHPRKLIVLHAYNAHFPYCDRYPQAQALIKSACPAASSLPTRATRQQWLDVYDNSVAESLAFLDAVAFELEARPGEAFLAYTSDHGENVVDDERELIAHALKFPTPYDIRVPAIFWANAAWQSSHAAKWRVLEANRHAQAMHADLVPTLLGAAGIRYAERRREVTDLTTAAPPKRTRWALKRLGEKIDADELR
jgi:glucan phosphoethanolaminetransferase (alkaline phosphatase superfamily)